MSDPPYVFRGFSRPTYTQVPDELFDELMPRLSETELKVLLYVVRRTFGFKKDSDAISLKQMVEGIKTRDGRQLDNGTGLSRPGVTKGVKGLVAKGVLLAVRNSSPDKGDEPTTYQLRFAESTQPPIDPLSTAYRPPVETPLPGGSKDRYDEGSYDVSPSPRNGVYPQETVVQETAPQETDLSNGSIDMPLIMSREDAERIAWTIQDVAREFADQAPHEGLGRAGLQPLCAVGPRAAGLPRPGAAARLRTKRYTANIKSDRLADGTSRRWPTSSGCSRTCRGQNALGRPESVEQNVEAASKNSRRMVHERRGK